MCDECYEVEDKYGTKLRYKKGSYRRHCLTEPAAQYADGGWTWCKDNKVHREDGPAEYWKGKYYFYLEDVEYSEQDYWNKIKDYRKEKLKDL